MRDILLTVIIFGSLPFILRNAYIGVMVWSWLSYMNPHRLTWNFAYDMPFAQIVAITLLIATLMDKDKRNLPNEPLTIIWIIFVLWMLITTFFAFYVDLAFEQLLKVYKIQFVTLLTILLINNEKKLDMLIWVIVLSIGFFSVKGGVFTFMTGGNFRVYGPPDSYIEENNAMAVATLMIIPLMVYLYRTATLVWVRYGLAFAIFLSIASAIGSQSRGAFLAITAVGVFFWLKTKQKFLSAIAIVTIAAIGWQFMPLAWHERMDSIWHYEQDLSAMGRINAWGYAINVANSHVTGAGFRSWSADSFFIYAPDPSMYHAAHSIYFSVLADHGWIGLVMFLMILLLTWRMLSKIVQHTKNNEELYSKNLLARMIKVSLVAYMAGGAFLSLSYFDLPWHLVAITLILKTLTIGESSRRQESVQTVM